MEEEIKDPAATETGEGTPTPSASETQPAEGTDKSEAGTSDQPETEATPEQPSRAQSRIKQLTKERNYWKEIAAGNVPEDKKVEPTGDDEGITIDQVADAVDARMEKRETKRRAEEARELAIEDATRAEAKYPVLNTDQDLADAVLALAQSRGISITSAADVLVGKVTMREVKSQAETKAKEGAATPEGSRAGAGESQLPDLSQMSPEEKKANWPKILESYNKP